jgi:hypothetical protein
MQLAVGLIVGCMFGMMVMSLTIAARQNELCPRCNSELIENICPYCGYEIEVETID